MSELANYLLDHHLDIISNTDDVKTAALEVIKAQDAALEEARFILQIIDDHNTNIPKELFFDIENWVRDHPIPPAQAGGK